MGCFKDIVIEIGGAQTIRFDVACIAGKLSYAHQDVGKIDQNVGIENITNQWTPKTQIISAISRYFIFIERLFKKD